MPKTINRNKFKTFLPLILFVVMLFTIQNWWRVQLLIDPITTQSIKEQDVVLYSTSWCPYCRKARNFLRQANVPFTEYDIEKSAQAYARYEKLSGRGVPVIRIGEQTIQGYDRDAIREALAKLSQSTSHNNN